MIYDTKKRRFVFANKAAVPPSAILFYDLPALLSPGEDICPEVTLLAWRLSAIASPAYERFKDFDRWFESVPEDGEPVLLVARTCNGCRALEMLQAEPARCTLGFQFDNRFRPAAPCPKPTTIRELIAANRRIDMKIKRYTKDEAPK